MKKIVSVLLVTVLLLTCAVSALAADIEKEILKIERMTTDRYYTTSETFGAEVSQRGFCISPDGKYLFGSFLFGDAGVVKFDANTGEPIAKYKCPAETPKSIACDDRGILYVGLSNAEEKNYYTIIAVDYETMTEIAKVKITLDGKGQAGLNGMRVAKEGDKYVLYHSINYDFALIGALDVTNTSKMKIDTSFCEEGYMDLQNIAFECEGAGMDMVNAAAAEVQSFDLDDDGNFYLAFYYGALKKGDALVKVDHDGNFINAVECFEIYGVDYYEGYVFACSYEKNYGMLYFFDGASLEELHSVEADTIEHGELVGVAVTDSKIYVADQRHNNKSSFLTVDVNFGDDTPTPPPATSEPPVSTTEPPVSSTEPPVSSTEPPVSSTEPPVSSTEPPVSSTEPPVSSTEPPVSSTEPPVTGEPPVTTAPTTDAPFTGDAIFGVVLVAVAALGCAVIAKKKR